MYREILSGWDDRRWEQEYEILKSKGEKHASPRQGGASVAVKTLAGNIHVLEISDPCDHEQRSAMENAFLEKLKIAGETQVLLCYATVNGVHPEVPSWNLLTGLIALDERNMDTVAFLWGGKDTVHAKHFCNLLPPKK